MLDMIELGLTGYRGLGELAGLAKRVGSKPAFIFAGEKWGREETYGKLQNILLGTLSSASFPSGARAQFCVNIQDVVKLSISSWRGV